jgi:hypothetical protein
MFGVAVPSTERERREWLSEARIDMDTFFPEAGDPETASQ